jgi:DNA-directed RNA polymerase subunit RPC12/RpoP
MDEKSATARCVECRSDIAVPESYAHGDHIRCGTCGTGHRILRGDVLRLVLADTGPLKDAVRDNAARLERLEDELRGARGHVGMGFQGLYVGVAYVALEVLLNHHPWTAGLIFVGLALALVCGVALEVLNFYFLSKRTRIEKLSAEIEDVQEAGRELRQKLREATRY